MVFGVSAFDDRIELIYFFYFLNRSPLKARKTSLFGHRQERVYTM